MKYNFDCNIFDTIDTEEKAYWLGFLWCDGYVSYRKRSESHEEYSLKLDLAIQDEEHILKFKRFLNSSHPIKFYKTKGFSGITEVARLYICHKTFGQTLHSTYGIRAGRHEFKRYRELIPNNLFKHFIRGCLDADGSLIVSNVELYKYDNTKNYTRQIEKIAINFSTYFEVLEEIQTHLYEQGIIESINKVSVRHEDRDGFCGTLKYGGNLQCKRIANYLYGDASIYLDRKYKKYEEIMTL